MDTAEARWGFGACPSAPTQMSNFDASQYVGTWYEIARDWTFLTESFQSCIVAAYSVSGSLIRVVNSSYLWPAAFIPIQLGGYATFTDATGIVSFADPSDFNKDPNYVVIDTDYTSYSLVYACKSDDFMWQDTYWFLSRDSAGFSDSRLTSLKEAANSKMPDGYDYNFWMVYSIQGASCDYSYYTLV